MKNYYELIIQKLFKDFENEHGFYLNLVPSCSSKLLNFVYEVVNQELEDSYTNTLDDDELETISNYIYNGLFNYNPAVAIQKVAYPDKEYNKPTSWGFVISPTGNMWHLLDRCLHGKVVAASDPLRAYKLGYLAPTTDSKFDLLSVFDYQEYIMRNPSLGYVQYSTSIGDVLRFDGEFVTTEHVKSLKSWVNNMSLDHEQVITDFGDYTFNAAIAELDKVVNERKMSGKSIEIDIVQPFGDVL